MWFRVCVCTDKPFVARTKVVILSYCSTKSAPGNMAVSHIPMSIQNLYIMSYTHAQNIILTKNYYKCDP